jgi:quercetin dioxygenase-like cupin family protein
MEDRRTFLGIAAASLLPAVLESQTPTAPAATGVARHALNGPLEGFEVVLLERSFRPGAGNTHRHPGIVLGYVMDGPYRFAINNEPERIVSAGGTFFEPIGAAHTTSGSAHATTPARVLVFMVVPKGSPTIINPSSQLVFQVRAKGPPLPIKVNLPLAATRCGAGYQLRRDCIGPLTCGCTNRFPVR